MGAELQWGRTFGGAEMPRGWTLRRAPQTLQWGRTFGGAEIAVLVKGGGVIGQASSVRLGLARAILKMDPELRMPLSHAGFLSRDAREKERKKPGLKGARKAPTYTKR